MHKIFLFERTGKFREHGILRGRRNLLSSKSTSRISLTLTDLTGCVTNFCLECIAILFLDYILLDNLDVLKNLTNSPDLISVDWIKSGRQELL